MMKPTILLTLALCCMLPALSNCGGSAPDPRTVSPQWSYQPDGVKLRYRADARLNEYDGEGHTVSMCVYQLTQPNGFNDLVKTKDGLLKLLDCKSFDQTVVYREHIFVDPSQDQLRVMDRAENATYLAVVAGYNELNPLQSARLFKYPIEEETTGVFVHTTIKKPGKVFVNLFLGPFGIQRVGSQ